MKNTASFRATVLATLVLATMTAAGCSISDSIESVSDSLSSPFTSSSKSSSGEKDADYREEVRDYTKGFVSSGGNAADFRAGLGKVAARHKVSNWEANTTTFTAVGEGLAAAGASRATVDGYKSALAAGNAANADAIEKGYSSAKK